MVKISKKPNISKFLKWNNDNSTTNRFINITYGTDSAYIGPLYDCSVQGNTLYLKVEDDQFLKILISKIKQISGWTKSKPQEVYFAYGSVGEEVGKDAVERATLEGVDNVKKKLKSITEIKVGDKIPDEEEEYKTVKKVTKTTKDNKKGVEVEFESKKTKKTSKRFYKEDSKINTFSEEEFALESEGARLTKLNNEFRKIAQKEGYKNLIGINPGIKYVLIKGNEDIQKIASEWFKKNKSKFKRGEGSNCMYLVYPDETVKRTTHSEEENFAAIASFIPELAKVLVKLIPEDMIKDIPAGRLSTYIYKELVHKQNRDTFSENSQKDYGISLNLPKEQFSQAEINDKFYSNLKELLN